MRLAALVGPALLWLLLPAPAPAQNELPRSTLPGVSDVPSGPAVLRGRIVHATRPEATANLPVVLYALPQASEPGLRGAVSDAEGRFAFEGISNDPSTPYLVGVSYAEVPFGTRTAFEAGSLELDVSVEISEPTQDASGVEVGELRIRVEPGCSGLQLIESQALSNPTGRVIRIGAEERAGRTPIFEIGLPDGAEGFETASGSEGGVERDGDRVRFWGPLFPGEQTIQIGYGLQTEPGPVTVRRRLHSGASQVVIETSSAAPAPRGEGLRPAAGDGVPERRRTLAGAQSPGAELRFRTEAPGGAAPAGLALRRAQLWVELDEAAARIDERFQLEVDGNRPLLGSGAPLLCLELPEGAQELRFSGGALELGLARDASGALAVRGPLPAGESILGLGYLLPSDERGLELTRRFPAAVPLLSMYVADTGVVVDSPRLHPRRPVFSQDRVYQQLEAFEVAAGEPVRLSLQRLPAARIWPAWAGPAFVLGAALVSLAALAGPLSASRGPARSGEEATPARMEREALYAAIRDLDHDHETGKLSPEDYRSFREELRARAVELLRAEREATPERVDPRPEPQCPGCGAAHGAGARFCSQCGVRLAPDSE